MDAVKDFILGFAGKHVDYSTRHFSRAYAIGGGASMACIIASPFVIGFVGGIAVGAVLWR